MGKCARVRIKKKHKALSCEIQTHHEQRRCLALAFPGAGWAGLASCLSLGSEHDVLVLVPEGKTRRAEAALPDQVCTGWLSCWALRSALGPSSWCGVLPVGSLQAWAWQPLL